jgi:Spy/CpxP family protein refolding chaperone
MLIVDPGPLRRPGEPGRYASKEIQVKNLVLGVIVSVVAVAATANTESPYVGQETREIKALSQQEINGYLHGSGLGYAKAAELNHYPGPRHVLELANELALTPEQTRQTQAMFETMKAQAVALGKQLVEKEQELDRQFAHGSIDAVSLQALLSAIGVLQAKIRYAHLVAHLEQKALLTQHQVQLYDQLRGYGAAHGKGHRHSH